jgi:hypothetical protein
MNKLYITILCLVLLALGACSDNLFGSSGSSGKGSCVKGKDIDCWIIEAEERFRGGHFEDAYKAYEEVINIDSTRSVGYYGMAKSGLWMWGLNVFSVFDTFKDRGAEKETKEMIKFLQEEVPTKTLNNYFQGAKKALKALEELDRREALGLSDMEYSINDFNPGFFISKLLHTLLSSMVFDAWGNGCIFKNTNEVVPDPIAYGCNSSTLIGSNLNIGFILTIGEDGMPVLNLDALFNSNGTVDQDDIDALNARLGDLSGGLGDLADFLGTDSDDQDFQESLSEFKDYSSFYVLQDGKDNDGDGCIDEEIMFNGKTFDADNDYISGEDSRFVPTACWVCGDKSTYPYECTYNLTDCSYDTYTKRHDDDYFIMTIKQVDDIIDTTVVYFAATKPDFWATGFSMLSRTERNELKRKSQTECWSEQRRRDEIGGCWNWNIDHTESLKCE